MSVTVLVATPHQAFGELLRLSLEEEGHYRVRLVRSAREAVALISHTCQVAILDGDLSDIRAADLGGQLLTRLPGLKIVVIPPENDIQHPSLAGMVFHGHILRPFYLPDLLDLMARLTSGEVNIEPTVRPPAAEPPPAPEPAPGAAAEPITQPLGPGRAAFERALGLSSAVAGLLLLEDGEALSGGQMTPPLAEELAALAGRALKNSERTDLVRFVRLPGQSSDHLFYCTPLGEGRALSLAYAVGTPLSRVRLQAGQVARSLAAEAAAPAPAPEAPPQGSSTPAEEDLTEDEGAIQAIDLAALLGSVPPPDPARAAPGLATEDWVPEISMSLPRPESEAVFPWDEAAEATRPVSVAPAARPLDPRLEDTQPILTAERPPAPGGDSAGLNWEPAAAEEPTQPVLTLAEPPVDELEDTRPRVLTNLTHIGQLEPVTTDFSQLSYTCVLIPRLPQHHLTGPLGENLGQWVHRLCLAYGWRLEGIAIRPEYLQWTVQVSPSIAPGSLMRITRQHTSAIIFETFPALAQQNPSGDFWATGYLIVSGPQPPSPRLLRDYIAETRRRQGVAFPGGQPPALPADPKARS